MARIAPSASPRASAIVKWAMLPSSITQGMKRSRRACNRVLAEYEVWHLGNIWVTLSNPSQNEAERRPHGYREPRCDAAEGFRRKFEDLSSEGISASHRLRPQTGDCQRRSRECMDAAGQPVQLRHGQDGRRNHSGHATTTAGGSQQWTCRCACDNGLSKHQ